MKLRYLKRNNYFIVKEKTCPFYLDENRKITRLWDGVFVTGLFKSFKEVIKIDRQKAIELTILTREDFK